MKNLIKAQLYMLPKYKLLHIGFVGIALLMVMLTYLNIGTMKEYVSEAGVFAVSSEISYMMIPMIFAFISTATICLGDFSDKTSYYELLGGHTRTQVYFSRVIPAVVLAALGTMILFIIPDITATVILGWGNEIPVEQVIFRRLLLIFPVVRICCEFVFISFLIKNMIGIMIAGYVVIMGGSFISAEAANPWLGMTSIKMLYNTDVWTTFGLDSVIHFSFDASLQPETVVQVIAFSLAASAICLIMGWYFFRKDDMN